MTSQDPYDLVLADLRTQRAHIDAAIKAIELVRGMSQFQTTTAPAATPSHDEPAPFVQTKQETTPIEPLRSAPYAGLTIYDAAIKELRSVGRAMHNNDIATAIQKGGLKLNAADPYNTVGSVLTRRFFDHGDVVRVGRGTWGLPEWYPGRDFRAEALAKRADKRDQSDADLIPSDEDNSSQSEDQPISRSHTFVMPPSYGGGLGS